MLFRMSGKTAGFTAEDFMMAISMVVRRIRTDAPPELRDFTWTQKAVLSRLEKGPATSAELARAEGIKPQSMGVAIALLEEMQLVERKPHPTDGRQMNVKLTAKGVALRKRTKEAKETWVAQAFARLDKQELSVLSRATELMKRMLET
jgi:DNA-binding MarR family transcriptional regulator